MYTTCFNFYTFKEALCNAGCRDDTILGRKVPIELWMILYNGLIEMGVNTDMLLSETQRASLWVHFNRNTELLEGLSQFIFRKLGLSHFVRVCPQNITDGNYLYNMASILPNRLLMVVGYCLINWGKAENEYWVRTFLKNVFMLYLVIAGYIIPKKTFMIDSIQTGYSGPIKVLCEDIIVTKGLDYTAEDENESKRYDPSLDYLFIFNNNVLQLYNSDNNRKTS